MRRATASLILALAIAPVETASACGGFFCSSAPIDQSKEIIVYSYEDDGSMTMAVQVRYEGQDEQFAWILPLPVPPDSIDVGTGALFQALHQTTAPVFAIENVTEGTCRSEPHCQYPSFGGCAFGCGAHGGATPPYPSGEYADAGARAMNPGDLTIYSRAIVGPYETVVLGASTAAEVIDWLEMNGYDVPAESEPLLSPYAEQGHVFIALRLTANRVSDVLRPVVLRMPTDEACLPIRLTAIASTPALPIEAFFLADAQAHATNYSSAEVELGPDLFHGLQTWDDAVAARVAELGGQAFATDYAGPTPALSLALPDVSSLASETDPSVFLNQLLLLGYTGSPLLLDIFERYIQPPDGSDPRNYYNCLTFSSTAACGAPIAFDPAGLAARIDDEIRQPSVDAQALVDRHPYLTRLSTTIRREDMTVDPDFALDSGLPDVPLARTAQLVTECSSEYYLGSAPQRLEIGDAVFPDREGTVRTPEEECASMGGTLAPASSGCSATHTGLPLPSLLVMVGLGAALFYRTARRRSRR